MTGQDRAAQDRADQKWVDLRHASRVFEDAAVLALNKPAGWSVMGERHDTDLVDLAGAAGETLFPVHRIDKVTSGMILFAKDLATHGGLTRQFTRRTVDKAYLAVTRSTGLPALGTIDLPLSAGRKGRVRIAAPRESIRYDTTTNRWWIAPEDLIDTRRYPSTTLVRTVWSDGEHSLVLARPVTGRRHQIRVHLAWIGHPILGDPLFSRTPAAGPRTYLHSWLLGIDAAWRGDRRLRLEAVPGPEFWDPVRDRLDADAAAHLLDRERDAHPSSPVTR